MSTETIITLIISFFATLGLGGIMGVLIQRRFEQQKQSNEHDLKIFKESDLILTEQKLHEIADFHLLGDHSIDNESFFAMTNWCRYFEQVGNQYLDNNIGKENKKLFDNMNILTDFIATNFFTIRGQNPSNNNQYLKPDWNPERGIDPSPERITKYQEYASKLKSMTRQVLKQYSEYRHVVKRTLKI